MFPSNLPLLPLIQFVGIVFAVVMAIALTHNALALFALFFAWNSPPFVHRPEAPSAGAERRSIGFDLSGDDDDEDEDAVAE